VEGDVLGRDGSRVPHFGQLRLPPGTILLQVGHFCGFGLTFGFMAVPQTRQNLAVSGTVAPHFVQFLLIVLLLRMTPNDNLGLNIAPFFSFANGILKSQTGFGNHKKSEYSIREGLVTY
jgi:hypothetical protein